MIKLIIIDDEKHALITLEHLLEKFKDVEVLATVQESIHAKEIIEKLKPDLILLDIEMPLLNGFDVLEQFKEIHFKVIFTTAYDQYAIKALKVNALDYILKPIDAKEMREALDKYNNNQIFTTHEQLANLAKFNIGEMLDTLALSTSKGLLFIKIKDIMYLTASSSYTYVKMVSGETHLVSKSLSNFEEVLTDYPYFFRPFKSNIVNLHFVKQYIRGEGGELIMQDNTSIVVSRTKKQEFLNLFKKI
ncbi:response regulator transcription factor [Aequorivita sp. H23M31]|uniref:Response regulator transcription factor n=1 Tax=Aequorivita ciconiae TaxID=2494375 RepID=A0A410G1A5_9FLAO|nr:LytTR family DNA-binding domain-containing protein [Aequorivita sp. H23M31]QAA81047.1 response regulator transcription factor [Aequorivita sp. H23M31]